MQVALRVLTSASTGAEPVDPTWVKSCDVDAMDGFGLAELTSDPTEALLFDSMVEAWTFWRQQSTARPLRDDGEPNRPLTAYTVEIGTIDE
jgi:hypothetical protein